MTAKGSHTMKWTNGDKLQSDDRNTTLGEVRRDVDAGVKCWLLINGFLYDATDLVKTHAGPVDLALPQAGPGTSWCDASAVRDCQTLVSSKDRSCQCPNADESVPSIERMSLLEDFEPWAEKMLSGPAWAYYRSAADHENSYNDNLRSFHRYVFRPRMLRDMTNGSTSTSFLGVTSELPIFISPVAMAKLGHSLGEINITKAAGRAGIVQTVRQHCCSLDEIVAAKAKDQAFFYQIYLEQDRTMSSEILRNVERLGFKAIIFTVDVGWESKRTLESRYHGSLPESALGTFMANGRLQDRRLSWNDIAWIRQHTDLPIMVKGIQSVEDVILCIEYGAEAVMISNHGGRQLDYAPAPIDILYELRSHRPDLFHKIEIFVDGGVRSGADVIKLLALGAKGVGIGRPFLYANATHGQEGVARVIEILRTQITNTMRNMGAATIADLRPEMVGPAGAWVGVNRPPHVPAPYL